MLILIVDDNQQLRELLADALSQFDWKSLQAGDGQEALEIYSEKNRQIDAILLDQVMPKMDGLRLLPKLLEINPLVPVVMMTAHGSITLVSEFMKRGGAGFIEKPITHFEILKLRMEDAIQHVHRKKELDRVRSEQEVRANLNEAKNNFLASMSHELRTPLMAIFPFAVLAKRKLADQQWTEAEEMLDRLLAGQSRLLRFITNIESLAQLYTGKFPFHPITSDLVQLIQKVVQERRLKSTHVSLQWQVSGLETLSVCFDMRAIRMALIELTDNAMKFSPEGGVIEIITTLSGQHVQVSIFDAGSGILPHDSETIFHPFTEGSHTLSNAVNTGLGLSIARGMAQLHDGTVFAENRKDSKGLSVTLTFPVTQHETP